MAIIAKASANFTATTTWAQVETGTDAEQESFSTSTPATEAYQYSVPFTCTDTNVIDGFMLFVLGPGSGGTGTNTFVFSDDGGTTATREVTIDTADIPAEPSYIFIKFGSTYTVTGGDKTNCVVGWKESAGASNVSLYRTTTAGDYLRLIRLTADAASVGAGQDFYIMGEKTGQGAETAVTVTMNETATTDYGEIRIGDGGTLSFDASSAANPYLRISQVLHVRAGGTLNIGTSGTPIPIDSVAVLEFDCASDGHIGLKVYDEGIFNVYGVPRTAGKLVTYCLLTADEAVDSTQLAVDTDTGWLDNDEIVVASTTNDRTETEKGAIDNVSGAGASTIDIDGFGGVGGGLANLHHGATAPAQAEVINLTRNVKIRSVSSSNMTFIWIEKEAIATLRWCELLYMGENVTNKRGLEVDTTIGSFDAQYCSLHDFEDGGLYLNGAVSNVTFSNNVLYNCNNAASAAYPIHSDNASAAATITNNVIMNPGGSYCAYINNLNGITYDNNRHIGSDGVGAFFPDNANTSILSFDGNVFHSSDSHGIEMGAVTGGTISNLISWRNIGSAFIALDTNGPMIGVTFDTCQFYGSAFQIEQGVDMVFDTCTFAGDSVDGGNRGVSVSNDYINDHWTFKDCDFGTVSGIAVAQTESDIWLHNTEPAYANFLLYNCTGFTAPTPVQMRTIAANDQAVGMVRSSHHKGVASDFKTWTKPGSVETDRVIYRGTSGQSMRMTPTDATEKLKSGTESQYIQVPVASGNTVSVTVYVRESVVGDGTDYNGNRIRLVQLEDSVMGVASDTVMDTATASSEGAWEQLSGTTVAASADGVFQFFVDCDGTTGWVNVDDWSVS